MSTVTIEEKTEVKMKIIDWNRHLFPELAESLEKHGQIEDVLRDEDGITIDGAKREILLGSENVRVKVVPKDSAGSNVHHLNRIQRKAVVNHKLLNFTRNMAVWKRRIS